VKLNQIEEMERVAAPYMQSFSDVDGHPAMVVQYVPKGGTGATAATCQVVVATGLTFTVGGTTPAGTDAIGASGVVSFDTYTTMGTLADYINGHTAWRCYLVGALWADASKSKLLVAAATSCIGATGYTIYHDASATDHGSFAISGERFINNGLNGHIKDVDGCRNSLCWANINVGITGSTPQIAFYFEKQKGTTVQSSFTRVMVDDTLEEIGVVNPMLPVLTAPTGYRIVGRVSVATTYDDIALFEVGGKSVFLDGSYIVTKQNWS